MPWLLYICKFFSDFLCSDVSLLFVTVTLRGVSNKHCLLSLFSLYVIFHYLVNCIELFGFFFVKRAPSTFYVIHTIPLNIT